MKVAGLAPPRLRRFRPRYDPVRGKIDRFSADSLIEMLRSTLRSARGTTAGARDMDD
jgi:hypothetical protein